MRRNFPLPHQAQAICSISGVPSALKRFMRAMRMCTSAICLSESREAMGLPKDFRQLISASILLRSCFEGDSQTISSSAPRPSAASESGVCRCEHGGQTVLLTKASVFADGYHGCVAAIQNGRVTPPGVKSTIAGHGADLFIRGIWLRRSGRTGLSPLGIEVKSTARMLPEAVSMAT